MRRHKPATTANTITTTPPDTQTQSASGKIDDDRPMRRVSYLRATANDSSLQLMQDSAGVAASDADSTVTTTTSTAAESTTQSPVVGNPDGSGVGGGMMMMLGGWPAARSPDGIDAQTIAQQLKRYVHK